jgi:hypothetical protein
VSRLLEFAFAVLISGKGSPPHIDTIAHLPSQRINSKGKLCYDITTTLAVGYIVEGVKYFWALPPHGGASVEFMNFMRGRRPQDMTIRERDFRRHVLGDAMPHPFQGRSSMGWSSTVDWTTMGEKGINNHFHAVIAGDVYVVVDGSWHAVWNHVIYTPISVAHDDEWICGAYMSDVCRVLRTMKTTDMPNYGNKKVPIRKRKR